jgi:hypothetical protein
MYGYIVDPLCSWSSSSVLIRSDGVEIYIRECLWAVDNIKIDLREIGWDGMDWIDLAQDRDQ